MKHDYIVVPSTSKIMPDFRVVGRFSSSDRNQRYLGLASCELSASKIRDERYDLKRYRPLEAAAGLLGTTFSFPVGPFR